MPSPLGHSLAGLAVGWLAEPRPTHDRGTVRDSLSPFVLACAALAILPDADLLVPRWHRTATHSLTATALIFIVAMVVTGKVTGKPAWRFSLALVAAHLTHLLLDWLGTDRFLPPGFQLFWPFLDRFFYSGIDLFPAVERRLLRPEALAVNAYAAAWEVLLVAPVALLAWRARRLNRGRAVARGGAAASPEASRVE